jgi:hypothetical protein
VTTDRTPIVLALLDDLVRARVEAQASNGGCTDADLLHLSDGLTLAIDHGSVAALWPPSETDHSDAMFLEDIIHGSDRFGMENNLPMVIPVTRRLADVAASLLVRGDTHRHEAAALWDAASRLLGLASQGDDAEVSKNLDRACKAAGIRVVADNVVLSSKLATWAEQQPGRDGYHDEAMRLRDTLEEARRQVKSWQAEEAERRRERDELRKDLHSAVEQLAELTRQREEARAERDKAQDDIRRVLGVKVPNRTKTNAADADENPDSLRSIALKAGAVDCTIYVDTSQVTVVVDGLRHGRSLRLVADAVFSAALSDLRTIAVRTTGMAGERIEIKSPPEPRVRD